MFDDQCLWRSRSAKAESGRDTGRSVGNASQCVGDIRLTDRAAVTAGFVDNLGDRMRNVRPGPTLLARGPKEAEEGRPHVRLEEIIDPRPRLRF